MVALPHVGMDLLCSPKTLRSVVQTKDQATFLEIPLRHRNPSELR